MGLAKFMFNSRTYKEKRKSGESIRSCLEFFRRKRMHECELSQHIGKWETGGMRKEYGYDCIACMDIDHAEFLVSVALMIDRDYCSMDAIGGKEESVKPGGFSITIKCFGPRRHRSWFVPDFDVYDEARAWNKSGYSKHEAYLKAVGLARSQMKHYYAFINEQWNFVGLVVNVVDKESSKQVASDSIWGIEFDRGKETWAHVDDTCKELVSRVLEMARDDVGYQEDYIDT